MRVTAPVRWFGVRVQLMVRTTAVLTLVATLTALPILWPATAPDADAAGDACEGGFLKIPALVRRSRAALSMRMKPG